MRISNIRERILTIFTGLFIILLSLYFYDITKSKQSILKTGTEVKARVAKITNNRNSSIYVEINSKEYKAGEAFGPYYEVKVGDTVNVIYKPGINYVVLKGKRTYLNTIIFEFIVIALGCLLISIGIFYKEKGIKVNKGNALGSAIAGSSAETSDSEVTKNQILLAYKKDKHKVMGIIEELLLNKDSRVEAICDALLENHCFSNNEFVTFFKKLTRLYFKNQEEAYLDIIKTFITSEQVEDKENQSRVLTLIENSNGFSPRVKKELLSLLNA